MTNKQALREEFRNMQDHYSDPADRKRQEIYIAAEALLDELEVSQKSNEFLKDQLAELANFNPDWDKLEASYESWREIAAELLVAKDRIAQLEQRQNIKLCQKCNGTGMADSGGTQPWGEPIKIECDCTAPPAPVAVPEEVASAIESLKQTLVDCNRYNYCFDAVKRVEDACSAAMLQGAEPISQGDELPYDPQIAAYEKIMEQAIPDGYALVPIDMAPQMMRAVQINSELGAYAAANLSGAYSLFREFWDVAIAAAPQQEVK